MIYKIISYLSPSPDISPNPAIHNHFLFTDFIMDTMFPSCLD